MSVDRALYLTARRQATLRTILSPTAFARDARQQALQWHVWTDGSQTVVSAISVSGKSTCKWEVGPPLTYGDTLDGAKLAKLGVEIASRRRQIAIGLILHVGDEFSVQPVREAAAAPDQYAFAASDAVDNPVSVVESSIQQGAAYRFVPTPASRSGIAVMLARRGEKDMAAVLDPDGPLRLSLASSPLEMVALVPALTSTLPDAPAGDGRPYMALIIYPAFTVLAVYAGSGDADADDSDSRLHALTALPHGNKDIAQGVASRVAAEMKRQGISGGTVYLISAGFDTDQALGKVVDDFNSYVHANPAFAASATLVAVSQQELKDATSALPGQEGSGPLPAQCFRPEFVWSLLAPSGHPAGQNFSTGALFVGRQQITRADAVLCVCARMAIGCSVVGLLAYWAFAGFGAWNALRSEGWRVDPAKAVQVAQHVERLNQLSRAAQWWEAALKPRSEAWVLMEFLSHLFPESGPFIATSLKYELKPLQADRKGSTEAPTKVGFVRTWVIDGLAAASASPATLNKTFVESAFAATGLSTGRALYTVRPTQRLQVSASSDRSTPTTVSGIEYSTRYQLSIEAVVLATDPEALPAGKAAFPSVIEL